MALWPSRIHACMGRRSRTNKAHVLALAHTVVQPSRASIQVFYHEASLPVTYVRSLRESYIPYKLIIYRGLHRAADH